jgi:hypothetical protein
MTSAYVPAAVGLALLRPTYYRSHMAPLWLARRCLAPVPLGVTHAGETKAQVVGNSCSQHLVTLATLISWRPCLLAVDQADPRAAGEPKSRSVSTARAWVVSWPCPRDDDLSAGAGKAEFEVRSPRKGFFFAAASLRGVV